MFNHIKKIRELKEKLSEANKFSDAYLELANRADLRAQRWQDMHDGLVKQLDKMRGELQDARDKSLKLNKAHNAARQELNKTKMQLRDVTGDRDRLMQMLTHDQVAKFTGSYHDA